MKTDLYFDNSLQLAEVEHNRDGGARTKRSQGVSAVNITMSSEYWNVNGKVKADVIATDEGSLILR